MGLAEKVVLYSHMTVEQKEKAVCKGLERYLRNSLGAYLDDDQIGEMAKLLIKLRHRTKDKRLDSFNIRPVTEMRELSNRMCPMKSLRKDELAYIIYFIAPAIVLSRIETAKVLKKCFPNFLSSITTINSTLSKYINTPRSFSGRLSMNAIPDHTEAGIEEMLIKLGTKTENSDI